MNEPFVRVAVVPDSPAWEDERKHSLGASEIPAVLGLSPYSSPLDVYRSKFGAGRDIDPELAFIGHAEELTIGRWIRKFRPELGVIRRGFMARSIEEPWLHASFDRFLVKRGVWTPVQMKTAHQYAAADWEEEVPLAVQAQVQAELFVSGAPMAYVVAFVGGRRFHLRPLARDEEFLHELLLPQARRFWFEHVLAEVPPDPSTSGEAVELWPDPEGVALATDDDVDLWEQLLQTQAIAKQAAETVDELKLALQIRMREKETLVGPGGELLATWKAKRGASKLNLDALRADHPDLVEAYTMPGRPTRQFLPKKIKEQKR